MALEVSTELRLCENGHLMVKIDDFNEIINFDGFDCSDLDVSMDHEMQQS